VAPGVGGHRPRPILTLFSVRKLNSNAVLELDRGSQNASKSNWRIFYLRDFRNHINNQISRRAASQIQYKWKINSAHGSMVKFRKINKIS